MSKKNSKAKPKRLPGVALQPVVSPNALLIGTAELLPEVREDVQRMVENPGIWIVTDENQPGAEIPIVSMGGKLYAIELSTVLAPERFLSTARVAGGPYRANNQAQARRANP